jgi:hypothetical protein
MYENLHAEGLGNFTPIPSFPDYYSSSQQSTSSAKSVDFLDGTIGNTSKDLDFAVSSAEVRAIRQF